MALTCKALSDLLFAYVDQTGTSGPSGDVSTATTTEKRFIALAITQALKEARKLNPGMFVQRPGIVLRAPSSGTLTVTQYSTAVTLGTLTLPNDGCTVRIGPDGLDNELNMLDATALRRQYEGASGVVSANLWHDCWVAADGSTFEAILGEVRANGRPLNVVNCAEDLDRYRLFNDFGNVAMARVRPAGNVQAVYCEQWARSPGTTTMQTRLRFAPMPSAATVVEAALVLAAPTITVTDVVDDTKTFLVPQALDETILFPLAMKRFMGMPLFRAPAETRKELTDQYAEAVNTLKLLRGHYAAENRLATENG